MSHPDGQTTAPAAGPAAAYRHLQATHQQTLHDLSVKRTRVLLLLAVALVAFMLLAFRPVREAFPALSSSLPGYATVLALAALFVFLVMRYLRFQFAIDTQARLLTLYATAMRRVDGSETQSGQTGPPAPASHLYARDLDLFGPDSLFGLLDTVRTTVGERGLAGYLLDSVSQPEAVSRQQAVRELMPQTGLRERIALLGVSNVQRISATLIDDWLAAPPPVFQSSLRLILIVSAGLATALLLHPGWFGIHPWPAVVPWLAIVLLLQAAVCSSVRQKVGPLLTTSVRLQKSIRLFSEGLSLLESLQFDCPKLKRLQQQAQQPAGAVKELRRLENLLGLVEQRGQPYFLPLSLLLAAGVQTAISIAHWQRANAEAMQQWLNAWSEFEALNALATYAFEHPENAWPELLPSTHPATYEAESLVHPLLSAAIPNGVSLNPKERFYLISGSNMSGKSTLLRSVGINAVLAYAGAPVCARSLRLTPLTLGASLALTDSLAEGKSRFLAEVQRLSAIVQASKSGPVLFLVDEIFSGTNSADRRTAAAAVLRTLLDHGALGALSTHDLALTGLATEANAGINLHMASPNQDDPLAFDYLLKPGINTSSNALAVVRMMGLDL